MRAEQQGRDTPRADQGPATSTTRASTTGTTGAERFPALRIGLVGGVVGMLCCVGPTVLALVGVLSATTAYAWAETLYGGYTWWFRVAGLLATVVLIVWALRRRQACSLAGARARWRRLLLVISVAVATYGVLYAATTALGTLAR
ncbi:MAG TPA: hypothetical protein VFE65_12910 [Pseudonocardia sp.]|jgi:hypothetical protein|nr:hypothetical protein [Pseudonocardia sp.]